MSKRGMSRLGVLGLALMAVLAFGAIGAGAAQASPVWSVEGAELGEESTEWGGGPVKFTRLGITIACGSVSSSGAHISNGASGGEGDANLLFLECEVEKAPYCEVPGLTVIADAQLSEVGGVVYEKYTPSAGKYFGTWAIEGWSCPIKGTFPVWGSFAAEVGPEGEAVESTRTFSQQALEATGSIGLVQGSNAWIPSGSASVWLNGSLEGSPFGPS